MAILPNLALQSFGQNLKEMKKKTRFLESLDCDAPENNDFG